MGKTVSQKKFLKGVNAGTGVLTEPPGTVTRISNLTFNQRGSMSTIDGSAIIGQLIGTNSIARAFGTFSNFSSGQYPYYPTLTSPPGYLVPDIVSPLVTQIVGFGNPTGHYTFAIVATLGSLHSNYVPSVVTYFNDATTFAGVTLSGWIADPATSYSLYYLPGGQGATQGVLITGPTMGASSLTFSGTFPTTPLVTLPTPNNSYNFGLSIGNIAPPSKQVFFTPTTFTAPSFPPQAAALAPGDPNFQFQSLFQQSSSYTTSGATVSASQTSPGTNTGTSGSTAALPAVSIIAGQILAFTLNVTYALNGTGVGGSGGGSQVTFQYSPDNGSTWLNAQIFGTGGVSFSVSNTTNISLSISSVTNLSNVLFRIIASATCGSLGGTFSASGTINSAMVTISASYSFTPYGGITGYVEPIPQILQFNQLSILILGNGYAPQSLDPSLLSAATISALTNTFQSTFPAWQAAVAWNTGDSIAVTVSAINYQMTAIQPGVSGGSPPTWPTTLGATINDGQVVWKNAGVINTSIAPRGAAHGIVYAGSLWLYNTSPATTGDQLDGPTCLKMSDSNNPNSWNPVNVAFLGKDDGTQGTGLATFSIAEVGIAPTASLVAFKEFATYQILGVFGASDFQIVQAQTNLGCIAARSIQFLPGYGIARLTHMGFAIFNGVNDTLVSEEIRPYLFGGTGVNADITGIDFTFCYLSQGCQSSSPPMYVCACPLLSASGIMTRLFIYDLVLKAWTIMDLPWAITAMIQALAGEGTPLTIAAKADGSGAVERLFAADQSWDAASLVAALPALMTPIAWTFRTTHVFREGSSLRQFYRSVIFRGYAAQAVAQIVTVKVHVNGNPFKSYQTRIQPQPFSAQFELQIDLMLTAQNVQVSVSGQGVLTMDGVDWNVTEKVGGQISVG